MAKNYGLFTIGWFQSIIGKFKGIFSAIFCHYHGPLSAKNFKVGSRVVKPNRLNRLTECLNRFDRNRKPQKTFQTEPIRKLLFLTWKKWQISSFWRNFLLSFKSWFKVTFVSTYNLYSFYAANLRIVGSIVTILISRNFSNCFRKNVQKLLQKGYF